jgi:outer membrane protein OmpA-like peptidoglycan-associated protein
MRYHRGMSLPLVWAALVLVLAGCATAPRPAAPPAAPLPAPAPARPTPPAPPPPAVAPELVAEQRFLEELFRGTPVTVGAVGPGPNSPLRLEVPLRYSFDEGSATVKPPLGAVLDRVARILERQPRARVQVATPGAERTASVRRDLTARRVASHRIERLPDRPGAVELRVSIVAPAVQRLD